MTLNEYQAQAQKTVIYPSKYALLYPTIGLAGEAGEVANKVKKLMRDREDMVLTEAERKSIASELGDCLWYVAAIAADLGVPLSTIADMNIEKLKSREERGALGGSGDTR